MLTILAWQPEIAISHLERTIVDRELRLGLHSLKYEDFERSIVKYGYTGRLTDTIIEEIAGELNLDSQALTDL